MPTRQSGQLWAGVAKEEIANIDAGQVTDPLLFEDTVANILTQL